MRWHDGDDVATGQRAEQQSNVEHGVQPADVDMVPVNVSQLQFNANVFAVTNMYKQQESCAIAKMSARCTIRQCAHGLKLESPFVPSSTDCRAVRAKIR